MYIIKFTNVKIFVDINTNVFINYVMLTKPTFIWSKYSKTVKLSNNNNFFFTFFYITFLIFYIFLNIIFII